MGQVFLDHKTIQSRSRYDLGLSILNLYLEGVKQMEKKEKKREKKRKMEKQKKRTHFELEVLQRNPCDMSNKIYKKSFKLYFGLKY